ncbi:MAG: HD domain-containing protein [Lachnospiraceae bacterium]|nr:HD domain-containing protein [Lachnospiraceae bacterium]
MMSYVYGTLLLISVLVILFMAQKNYENIDIQYWTIVVIVPLIILGYWLKTRVTQPETAQFLWSYIYLDSTILLAVTLFCILRFLGISVKPWVKLLVYGGAFVHLFIVWICVDNRLYYDSMTLIETPYGIATKMGSGPLKIIHWAYLLGIILSIVGLIIVAQIRRGTYSRRTLALYTTVVSIGLIMYIIEMFQDVDFSSLPFLYVIGDILIAINYDHAHTHDISCLISEQQKYRGTKGYVAFDLDGCYLSCNEVSYEYLPELKTQVIDSHLKENSSLRSIFYELIESFKEGKKEHRNFNVGEMICQVEINEFSIRKDGKVQGYLFDIRDVTEEQKVLQIMQDYNDTLNKEVEVKTENIKSIQQRVVLGLANMIENRDNNTGGHVKRTSDVIKIVVVEAKHQGIFDLSPEMVRDIVRAAPMHDLGKITVENAILNKPGKLTPEEFEIMKRHAEKSGEFVDIILQDVEEEHFVKIAHNIARYHHERWDGRGYPEGLVGEMIPLEARLMAIADVYDALVSSRSYKRPLDFEEAAQIMIDGMGSQFDPNMLSVFLGCREKLEAYYKHVFGE